MPNRRLAIAIALLSAGGGACLGDTTGDAGPPMVVITSPTAERVTGTIMIKASVVDESGVEAVAFYVDDVKLVELRLDPYQYLWPSASVPDGQHLLRVTAKDFSGNTGTATKTMTVDNAPN